MRRTFAVRLSIALTLILGALSFITSPQVQAAPGNQCNFKLSHIPVEYAVGPYLSAAEIGGSCTSADEWISGFNVVRSGGPGYDHMFYAGCSASDTDPNNDKCKDFWFGGPEYARTGRWQYITLRKIGTWHIYSRGMLAAYNNPPTGLAPVFPQQGTAIVAKYATQTRMNVTRNNAVFNFTVMSLPWNVKYHDFIQSSAADGTPIQIQEFTTSGWQTIHTVIEQCANRCWTHWRTRRDAHRHTFRAVVVRTTTRWGSRSLPKNA